MPVAIPGGRDVRASLDGSEDWPACVVACPPHPQHGGSRSDDRLTAVGDALGERGVACLRFDYGPWDEGRGERTDALNALAWARERFDVVGLFGYSFGGAVALLAAAEADPDPDALSVLAPAADSVQREVLDALDAVDCPMQLLYGERDDTADWEAVVDRARERGDAVVGLPADHFFVGQNREVAEAAAAFLADRLD